MNKVQECYELLMSLNGEEIEQVMDKFPFHRKLSLACLSLSSFQEDFYNMVENKVSRNIV